MSKNLDALIIDSSSTSRAVLKDAAHHTMSYRHVFVVATLSQAISQLEYGERMDVVLLSSSFGNAQIGHFIENARRTNSGENAAFVLIMSGSMEDSVTVARELIGGADGFILPPFSVDTVAQSVAIAEKVKRRQAAQRLSVASGLVVDSLMEAIDERARLLNHGKDRPFKKSVTQVTGQFRELAGEAAVSFVSVAIDKFSKIERPPYEKKEEVVEEVNRYTGPSEILKRRADAKKAREEAENSKSSTTPELAHAKAR